MNSRQMNQKLILGVAGLALALVAAGCSGINASKSISPLDFILPGLMQNCPPAPVVPLATNSAPLLVQASLVQL